MAALCALVFQSSLAGADDGSTQRTWGWVATGTGAAVLGIGAYALFTARSYADDPAYARYRENEVPSGENTCDFATAKGRKDIVDICDGNETWGTVFWITVPAGIVLTGTGVYLLATAPSEPVKAGWRLSPRTSPHGGSLDVSYRF